MTRWAGLVSDALKKSKIDSQENIQSKRIEQLFSVYIPVTIYLRGQYSQRIFRIMKIL